MAEKPTENLEAYQAYLRGHYYAGQPHISVQDWTQALKNYQDAVDFDTTFALAYSELARAHSRLVCLRQDLSELRLEKANQAAAKALRSGSDMAFDQLGKLLSIPSWFTPVWLGWEIRFAPLKAILIL